MLRCRSVRPWWSLWCWPEALFFLPDLEAKADATRRRAEFRHALGAYLDLVALEMAARAAPAEALPAAAKIGTGWPLALIRDTLYRATRAGRDPWAALSDLGQRIGVNELRDLGQLVSLVAHDGARVRSTLTARAHTMRRHELAEPAGRSRARPTSPCKWRRSSSGWATCCSSATPPSSPSSTSNHISTTPTAQHLCRTPNRKGNTIMITTLDTVRDWVTARIRQLRADGDRGEIPAQLVWMGVIVALAIAAGAVITSLVLAKANSINLQ